MPAEPPRDDAFEAPQFVRARSAGISAFTSLPHKLNRWAELAGVDAEPLAERLA